MVSQGFKWRDPAGLDELEGVLLRKKMLFQKITFASTESERDPEPERIMSSGATDALAATCESINRWLNAPSLQEMQTCTIFRQL